jgi:hypothetical protein
MSAARCTRICQNSTADVAAIAQLATGTLGRELVGGCGERDCFIQGRTRFCEVDGPHSSWAVGCVCVGRGSRRVPEHAAENVPSLERSFAP